MDKSIVLNLLKRTEQRAAKAGISMPLKRWAVVALLKWQPEARFIQFDGKCPNCKRKGMFLSYQLFELDNLPSDTSESCGWFCASCKWGNTGSREVWRRKLGNSRTDVR